MKNLQLIGNSTKTYQEIKRKIINFIDKEGLRLELTESYFEKLGMEHLKNEGVLMVKYKDVTLFFAESSQPDTTLRKLYHKVLEDHNIPSKCKNCNGCKCKKL